MASISARRSSERPGHSDSAAADSEVMDPTVFPDAAVSPPSGEQDDPLVGRTVAERYRVLERIGEGGMGSVYRAMHIHMRKMVALKVLHKEMTHVAEAVARFEREAVAAARIAHTNVAAALDFGRLDDGAFYLALEYVEGRSLRAELEAHQRIHPVRARELARQIADALAAAHAEGIVHRDLKPENVMLIRQSDGSDLVKVLDFGIAKVSLEQDGTGAQLTRMGSVFGTPDYMSPEQASGTPVDHRSDLYSLGIMLYEMITGRPPFTGVITAVLLQHVQQPPPPLPAGTDPKLGAIIERLLSKQPEARFESAQQLAEQLTSRSTFRWRPPQLQQAHVERARVYLSRALTIARRAAQVSLSWLRAAAVRVWQLSRDLYAAVRGSERVRRVLSSAASVRVGPFAVPVVALVAGGGALLLLGVLVWAWSRPEPAVISPNEPVTSETPPPIVTVSEKQDEGQARETVADISAIPVYKRSVEDWLLLGDAHARLAQWSESVGAFRNAMQLSPGVSQQALVVRRLRQAAEQPEAYKAAVNVAVHLLGEMGIDVIYDVWQDTRDVPLKRDIHEFADKKLRILRLSKASQALRVRLELEFGDLSDCEKVAAAVQNATKHADFRSLDALTRLRRTDGCGVSKKRDCYPCLRTGDELQRAIERAKATPAPNL